MTMPRVLIVSTLLMASFAQAQPRLDAERHLREAVAAMGGADALASIERITEAGHAKHWAPGESFETGGPPRFVGNASFLRSRDLHSHRSRTEWNRSFEFPFPHPQGFIEIATGKAGAVQGVDATDAYRTLTDLQSNPPAHAMSAHRLATAHRELERLSPRFWLDALRNPERLGALADITLGGQTLPAVSYRSDRGAFTLLFDRKSHLPARVRVLDNDALQGDSTFDLVFVEWQRHGNLMLPKRLQYELNGARIAEVEYTRVELNPVLPNNLFAIPESAAPVTVATATGPVPYQWVIRRQYLGLYLDSDEVTFDPQRGGLHLQPLASGIDQVLGGTHNGLIVEMRDHLIVFDAPVDESQALWTIEAAHKRWPDKPIRYLVLTHHHVDHAGGVRTYVANGATVVVAKGDKAFFEKVFAAPHTIVPDALQKDPMPATIIEVEGQRTLSDGTRSVVLHAVANPHVANMLIGWVPDAGVCFVADLWSPLRDTMPTGGQKALYAALTKLGIKPALIAGGHGTSAPFTALERLMAIPALDAEKAQAAGK